MMRFLLTLFISGIVASLATSSSQAQESYLVVERYSRRVLLAERSEVKRPVAGLSHVVTAKVVMDWATAAGASNSSLITVPQHQYHTARLNPLGLNPGDQLSIRDALYSILLGDDCVAATTLANHVGRDLMQRRNVAGDPVAVFVAEMNNLARSLGMGKTRFLLPCGADSLQKNSYSTASDMARLAVTLASDSGFDFYVKQTTRDLKVIHAEGSEQVLTVTNTNKLLKSGLRVVGLKTGYSTMAGECAAQIANKDFYVDELPDGKHKVTPVQLVVVVLGSAKANDFAKSLIPQGWSHYDYWRKQGYLSMPDRRGFLKLPVGQ